MQQVMVAGEQVYIEEQTGEFAVNRASWAVHEQLFNRVDDDPSPGYAHYTPRRQLPESCIESAEYAIQLFHDAGLAWGPDQERTPNVLADFGNRVQLNVTTSPDLQDRVTGVHSYPFASLPQVGEGIIIANRTDQDLPFNLHLGAVVARHRTAEACILTDLVESGPVNLILPWTITLVQGSVDGFRGRDYQGTDFALGFLHT